MGLMKEAYQALESIVGPEYVSEDPVVCEAYSPSRGGHGKDAAVETVLGEVPICVILPGSTEEVQKIVKICNRYKISFVPASTYWVTHAGPRASNVLLIDLKRMNRMEIDEKNMYAVVEPGVVLSQLQEQAMRRGLYITVGGGGAQASVLANLLVWSLSPLNYKNGLPNRRLLGVEWVSADGEILRLGSLATSNSYFWGEGPGPDLRGILRGYIGWFGGLGIVTKIGTKLLPFQPERLEPVGISPDTTLQLPTNRMRWCNFTMPSREALVNAMYEIGNNEIGAAVTKVPLIWRYRARAKSKDEFWRLWEKSGKEDEVATFHILRVLLIGYTSEKQLEYEERVLMDIIKEYGGEARRTRQTDESWLKNADSARMWLTAGTYMSVYGHVETLACSLKGGEAYAKRKRQYTPPLMDDFGEQGWFQLTENGHMGYLEFLTHWEPYEIDEKGRHRVDEWYFIAGPKLDIEKGLYNFFNITYSPLYLVGPEYGPNYHVWMLKIKEALDPNGISNPPYPRCIDELVERCDWLKY